MTFDDKDFSEKIEALVEEEAKKRSEEEFFENVFQAIYDGPAKEYDEWGKKITEEIVKRGGSEVDVSLMTLCLFRHFYLSGKYRVVVSLRKGDRDTGEEEEIEVSKRKALGAEEGFGSDVFLLGGSKDVAFGDVVVESVDIIPIL